MIPCAEECSPGGESFAKVAFKVCGFDGAEWFHQKPALNTFNLNTLIFWQLRPVLPSNAAPPSFAGRALHVVFWVFGLASRLFSRFGFVFLFDRVFITVIGQNQNWSKHGCRGGFDVGEDEMATQSVMFLGYFWLILNLFEPSPTIFCVFFRSWFLLFVNESKIDIFFVANWYKIYELKILPKWYQRVRIVHILDLINWK